MKKRLFALLLLALLAVPRPALAAEAAEVEVPIIMYHKVTKDPDQLGKYAITPGEFEEDLQFLQGAGYSTVTINQLIAYVETGEPLPENPIVLTFDDGYFSDYRYVFPLLQEYNMQAVLSIIGNIADEYTAEGREDITYPHLTWPQIQEMADTGAVEIQNHGYDLHCERMGAMGAQQRGGECDGDYAQRLEADLTLLQDRCLEQLGEEPTTFTYPFGAKSLASDEILKDLGFSASLICECRRNTIRQGDRDCLFSMGRIIRPHGTGLEEIMD